MPKEKNLDNLYQQLKKLIQQRQEFEKQHSYPPYSTYPTDINFFDVHRKTLLHYAIEMGDFDKVKELVESGANININIRKTNSPLELALIGGKLDIAKYLYAKGANGSEIELKLISDENTRRWYYQTIQDALCEIFPKIENKVSFNTENNPFFSPLISSNTFYKQRVRERAAEIGDLFYLEATLPDVFSESILIRNIEKENYSLLKIAAANGQLGIIEHLLETRVKNINPSGYTSSAFHEAICYQHLDVAEYLLNKGANIDGQDNWKNTSLMLAIRNNWEDGVQFLFAHGASIYGFDIDGNTIFHLAAQLNNPTILKFLLKNISEEESNWFMTVPNIYGQTPFDLAINKKRFQELNLPSVSSFNISPLDFIQQSLLIDKFLYYLKSQYRDMDFFSGKGYCRGLCYAFSLYGADYFYEVLTLLIQWDGNEEALNQPLPDNLKKIYHPELKENLEFKSFKELFEQWLEDITRFQTYQQKNHKLGHEIYSSRTPNYDKDQIMEILDSLFVMDIGTYLEIGGEEHAVIAYLNQDRKVIYYDPNIKHKVMAVENSDDLFTLIEDYKYIAIQKKLSGEFAFQFFNFPLRGSLSTDKTDLEKFVERKEEGYFYDAYDDSPNLWFPLHKAVITRNLNFLKILLENHSDQMNKKDRFGETPLMIALEEKFIEAIEMMLPYYEWTYISDCELILTKIYKNQMLGMAQRFINRCFEQCSKEHEEILKSYVLNLAIQYDDLESVRYIFSKCPEKTNTSEMYHDFPLKTAIKYKNEKIIEFLLQENCNQMLPKKTPSIKRGHPPYRGRFFGTRQFSSRDLEELLTNIISLKKPLSDILVEIFSSKIKMEYPYFEKYMSNILQLQESKLLKESNFSS